MIDYKAFIEHYFKIKTKAGEVVPFILNEDQDHYLNILIEDYPNMQGIRENDLKSRQVGWSSLLDAIGATDFIMAELGKTPLFDGDIVSHKDKETGVLFNRFNLFLDSYLEKEELTRKQFLSEDTGDHVTGNKGSQMWVQTASARVSGRGGTKQFIHWSEVAFYSNTPVINASELVTGAERQVGDGIGKIFRESTGNIAGEFFQLEYQAGKDGISEFKSRFFPWFLHKDYSFTAPHDWIAPEYYKKLIDDGITNDQCYWHFKKTKGLTDEKMMREYPSDDTEAFLLGGSPYFDKLAIIHYSNQASSPLKEVANVQSL